MKEHFYLWGMPVGLTLQSILAWAGDPPTRLDLCITAATGAFGWLILGLLDWQEQKKEKP